MAPEAGARLHHTEYHVRLAAYAWIVEDEQVLLTWWNGEGRREPAWTLPGGGVEFDEAILDGLVREVREETGFDVEPGAPLAEHFVTFRREGEAPLRLQRFVHRARIVGGQLGTLEVGGSTDFAQWMPLDEVAAQPARAEVVDVALAAHLAEVGA